MAKSPFDQFPNIVTEEITLRKIIPSDVDCLFEIYSNKNLFLHSPIKFTQNKKYVSNIIGHFERDYGKKTNIHLGICLNSESDKIVGVAEMFEYDKNVNMITIGYRLNDRFWGKGIAAKTVKAMVDYLFDDIGINRIQAFVMPENTKSLNVLRRNNFAEEGTIRQGQVWKGHGVVDLTLFSLIKSDRE